MSYTNLPSSAYCSSPSSSPSLSICLSSDRSLREVGPVSTRSSHQCSLSIVAGYVFILGLLVAEVLQVKDEGSTS